MGVLLGHTISDHFVCGKFTTVYRSLFVRGKFTSVYGDITVCGFTLLFDYEQLVYFVGQVLGNHVELGSESKSIIMHDGCSEKMGKGTNNTPPPLSACNLEGGTVFVCVTCPSKEHRQH